MSYASIDSPSRFSRWTSRVAVFSLVLVAAAVFLHRIFGMPTAVAFNVVAVAYAGALVAVIMALIASIGVWRHGSPGTARIVVGLVVGLVLLAAPLLLIPLAREHPPINDLTTDPANPPVFEDLARQRGPGTNPAAYPGAKFAAEQYKAYPDLKPIVVTRPASETFDLTVEALKRLRYDIISEKPNTEGEITGGTVEAVDRTLVLGFYDDIVLRVTGTDEQARIDIRSSSRFGRYDFGRNAERIREIMKEIVARLEATVPAADGSDTAVSSKNKRTLKQQKGDDPSSRGDRKSRDGAPTNSRRVQERKAPPP
jgi:uncharacterized protein (DUF1499 family)